MALLGGVAVALLVGVGVPMLTGARSHGPTHGSYLDPGLPSLGEWFGSGTEDSELGQPWYFTLRERVEPASSSGPPIHLLKVEILGLPSFVVVDRVGALKLPRVIPKDGPFDNYSLTMAGPANSTSYFEPWQPVTDVTLTRLCLGHGNKVCPGWALIAQVHMTEQKPWKSRGIRVTYEVSGKTYFQDYIDEVVFLVPSDFPYHTITDVP